MVLPAPKVRLSRGAIRTETEAGTRVMTAVAAALMSYMLLAVTVTVRCAVIWAGAVYMPVSLSEPSAGLVEFSLHTTSWPGAPVTTAANCWRCEFESVTAVGEMVTWIDCARAGGAAARHIKTADSGMDRVMKFRRTGTR